MIVFLKNDESGFTLLEALIAVMLSSIILLFLCSSIQHLNRVNELIIADAQTISSSKTKIKGSRQIEWHLFLNQLKRYLEDTELVNSTPRSIIVKEKNAGNIQTKYGRSEVGYQSFYRSKNNGYNAMLTDIKTFHLEIEEQWLLLNFTFQNEENYKGRIWIESWKTESNQGKN